MNISPIVFALTRLALLAHFLVNPMDTCGSLLLLFTLFSFTNKTRSDVKISNLESNYISFVQDCGSKVDKGCK